MSAKSMPSAAFQVKRVYAPMDDGDGARVLVDRLWPRGVSKHDAQLTLWLKAIAPTTELRVWFNHDPSRWTEFCQRYHAELDANPDTLAQLRALAAEGPVTLLYAAHDETRNHARVLLDYLQTGAGHAKSSQ